MRPDPGWGASSAAPAAALPWRMWLVPSPIRWCMVSITPATGKEAATKKSGGPSGRSAISRELHRHLLPFGLAESGSAWVKALAGTGDARLLAVGLLKQLSLALEPRSGTSTLRVFPALPQRTAFWFGHSRRAAILEKGAELGAPALDAD